MKYEYSETVQLNKWKLYAFSVNKMTKAILLKTSTWDAAHSLSGTVRILEQNIASNTVTIGYSSGFQSISLLSRSITILKYPFPADNLLDSSFYSSSTLSSVLRVNYLNYPYR